MGDASPVSIKRMVQGLFFCAALMYVAFIFTLTHMPLDGINTQPWFRYSMTFWLDKFIQCTLYSGLVGLLGCAMFPLNRDPVTTIENISGVRTALLFLTVVVIAIVDEKTQPYFGRNCEVLDMVADAAAIIPGFCVFLVLNEARHLLLNGDW